MLQQFFVLIAMLPQCNIARMPFGSNSVRLAQHQSVKHGKILVIDAEVTWKVL